MRALPIRNPRLTRVLSIGNPLLQVAVASTKPFHEMPLAEYLLTSDAARIPKNSIVALNPAEYTPDRLNAFSAYELVALATLWGVPRGGTKDQLVERIVARKNLRERLSTQTLESLCLLSRRELRAMAKKAALYYSSLSKRAIATALIAWRAAERLRAAHQIGEARHFHLVRRALIQGLRVPAENRERYGFDESGRIERRIYGVPLSVSIRAAPELIKAARELSQSSFLAWVENHPEESRKVIFIGPGILADRTGFWVAVQKAFAPPPQLTLFG